MLVLCLANRAPPVLRESFEKTPIGNLLEDVNRYEKGWDIHAYINRVVEYIQKNWTDNESCFDEVKHVLDWFEHRESPINQAFSPLVEELVKRSGSFLEEFPEDRKREKSLKGVKILYVQMLEEAAFLEGVCLTSNRDEQRNFRALILDEVERHPEVVLGEVFSSTNGGAGCFYLDEWFSEVVVDGDWNDRFVKEYARWCLGSGRGCVPSRRNREEEDMFYLARLVPESSDRDSFYYKTRKNALRILFGDSLYARKLRAVCDACGLNYEKEVYFWIENSGMESEVKGLKNAYSKTTRLEEFIRENVYRFSDLERVYPGSVRTLHERFGIEGFARYPKEMLIQQYLKMESKEPYGLIVNPKTDHNGGFSLDEDIWHSLFTQMQGIQREIRIVETSSVSDLYRILLKLDRKYRLAESDLGFPISFLIIGGHGTSHSVEFGEVSRKNGSLERKHLRVPDPRFGEKRRFTKEMFSPHVCVVFNACDTGYGEDAFMYGVLNIAEAAEVFAPEASARIISLDVSLSSSGDILIQPTYTRWDPDQGKRVPVSTRRAGFVV